mmetsp:Transcript_15092/g.31593  ORF Transcript_15092/g.31593 Transcript_15092/m.31593 type:complete len:204 (-) Transcript_15092:486-1097(-)
MSASTSWFVALTVSFHPASNALLTLLRVLGPCTVRCTASQSWGSMRCSSRARSWASKMKPSRSSAAACSNASLGSISFTAESKSSSMSTWPIQGRSPNAFKILPKRLSAYSLMSAFAGFCVCVSSMSCNASLIIFPILQRYFRMSSGLSIWLTGSSATFMAVAMMSLSDSTRSALSLLATALWVMLPSCLKVHMAPFAHWPRS